MPADPVRSTREAVEALSNLITSALPGADANAIATAFESFRPFASFLVPGEHLSRDPLTLVAGQLACDIYTLHGDNAVGADEPTAPPGASAEIDWALYVPIPSGAPFTAENLEAADSHLRAGTAPDTSGAIGKAAAVALADIVDAEALRSARGGS